MLEIVLHVLSVLGVIFLVLLGVFLALLLAVAFFPVSYRIRGSGDGKEMSLAVNVWWLFGLLRASYSYPEPGGIVAKALFFPIFDTAASGEEETDQEKENSKKKNSKNNSKNQKNDNNKSKNSSENTKDKKSPKKPETVGEAEKASCPTETSENEAGQNEAGLMGAEAESGRAVHEESGLQKKIQKLKYTISSLCDKIREIWENISYYAELLREEDTKLLFAHALFRAGRILKNIRPRHIKAEILYGFSSPDVTGCVYGIYCMLAPSFGSGVSVTPDFENCVFRGEFSVCGHITLIVALVNGLKLILDKKLKQFMNKMKKEKREVS